MATKLTEHAPTEGSFQDLIQRGAAADLVDLRAQTDFSYEDVAKATGILPKMSVCRLHILYGKKEGVWGFVGRTIPLEDYLKIVTLYLRSIPRTQAAAHVAFPLLTDKPLKEFLADQMPRARTPLWQFARLIHEQNRAHRLAPLDPTVQWVQYLYNKGARAYKLDQERRGVSEQG